MPPKNAPSELLVTPPFDFLAKLEHQRPTLGWTLSDSDHSWTEWETLMEEAELPPYTLSRWGKQQ